MLCTLLGMAAGAYAQCVDKQTYTFAIKGADTLKLDRYVPASRLEGATTPSPLVLFAFGGGFRGGKRDNADYAPYFRFLAQAGYVVVSTDYRTGLKDIGKAGSADLKGVASALQQAVAMAVEDFLDATDYIVRHSGEWVVDPAQIIACGTSAGAIAALQAEYELCNQTDLAGRVPAGFNYAGVISFAGAVCAQGTPRWKGTPCPMMLFHGDADDAVPFRKLEAGAMGLYGSDYISGQLEEMGAPYYLYMAEGVGHSMSYTPMRDNRYDILSFMKRLVQGKERRCIRAAERNPDMPSDYRRDFTIGDYLKGYR